MTAAATEAIDGRTGGILIIAGEVSGDMHAARLVSSLRSVLGQVSFFGIGGPRMRAAGVETLHDIDAMAVTGFTEAVRKFPQIARVFLHMLRELKARRPRAVILVDYPGFNLRFAARAHALGFKTIYYICPQVWAWNRRRIPRMARWLDLLVTIFPFEPELFNGTGLRAVFAGHPLVDETRAARESPRTELPWPGAKRLALLPGSRGHEVEAIFPTLWHAATRVEAALPDAGVIIAAASPRLEATLRTLIAREAAGPQRWRIVTEQTYEVLRQAHAAIIASGTATLEASLMECPMVVTYKVSPLTYAAARAVIRVPYIGMVNIVAGKEICPEILQGDASPENLATAVSPLLRDPNARETMIEELRKVNRSLGTGGAESAAAIIAQTLAND